MKDLSNENIIHITNSNVQYIQFRRLLQYKDRLEHCYTLKPIDIKLKKKDDINYVKICKALELDNDNVVAPNQTHTNNVGVVNENSKSEDYVETDGLVTNVRQKVLVASFADCTSLFLYDPTKNVIGNIHSGWKGTVNKIGEIAVNLMKKKYSSKPSDLICCIGPTIRKCHFEVEDDVKEQFEIAFNNNFTMCKGEIKDGKQKYYIDTISAIRGMLISCGLKEENIIDSGICTVCNSDILHSYRASKGLAGRNGAIMCLK